MALASDVPEPSNDPFVAFATENRPKRNSTIASKEFGRTLTWAERLRRPQYAQQPVFEPAEVAALLKYASEHGIDTDDHLLRRLYRALDAYNDNPRGELAVVVDGAQQPMPYAEVILNEYCRLTKLTGGISGRNLLHGRHLARETRLFLTTTIAIFATGIGALAYGAWIADGTPGGEAFLPAPIAHTIQYFAPFAWGALGACVYILKRISDEAAASRFDPDRFQGWQARALLGAVLGGTITYVSNPAAFGSATLSTTAIAFLAGLATKIVYGGIERLIALLSDALNLDAVSDARPKGNPVAEFLAQEISRTDPATEPEKYGVLVQLLQARTQTR